MLTAADYYTVSLRSSAYLHVAPQVAQYDEYRTALGAHLAGVKLRHWDRGVRVLAAQAIARIAPHDPPLVANTLIDRMVRAACVCCFMDAHGTAPSTARPSRTTQVTCTARSWAWPSRWRR